MKKHIIGFTIFAFIVGSFVSIWALCGYFTQEIPNVSKVESDELPIFASDKKTSCFPKRRGKLSYEVVDSYYFVDEQKVVSTLKLSWNGYGISPKNLTVVPKVLNSNNRELMLLNNDGKFLKDIFSGNNEVFVTVSSDTYKSAIQRKDNFYVTFEIVSDDGYLNVEQNSAPHQVIVVHGESSIKSSDKQELIKQ